MTSLINFGQMKVKIKKLVDNAVIPFYATSGSAGMDVTATSIEYNRKEDFWVYHTGLSFKLPEGYVMYIFPRSSIRKTNFYLANSVGVLDSDYTGELLLIFKERDLKIPSSHLGPYRVGDRIGQVVIMPYPKIEFEEVDSLDKTERGDGGFGSTGE